MLMPLTVWITTNCGKFLKRQEYQTTLSASWEICTQVKKQQLELDMEQQTGSKLGKEYIKAVYCYPVYLTSMQSTSCEMPGWMKYKLESRLLREISITSYTQMTPPLWQKVKRNWRVLDESQRGEWKSWLKTQHSKNKDHGIQSHHFTANRWGNNGNSDRLYFLSVIKSPQMVIAAMKLKTLAPWKKIMTNLDNILKNRDIILPTQVYLVKGFKSWTINKAKCRRTDAFELWCWRRLLRVPWTARRSNQSILKEINPEHSLEGLMLKLKLWYFGHLIRRAESLE